MTIIVALIVLIILWFPIDFYIGRKMHYQSLKKRLYPQRNGQWMLFGNGQELYTSLFNDIQQARDHIHVLFFIISDDQISLEFLSILRKKAAEGVTVKLLVDRIGGLKVSKREIQRLRESGVEFAYTHKIKFPFFFFTLNYRNHRKIAVIDGKLGYFGGFNIGKDYLGKDPKLGFWRDFHLKIFGDGVQDLQHEFFYDWRKATKETISQKERYFPLLQKGNAKIQFFPTDGRFMKEELLKLIHNAKNEIFIGTPYFIPGKEINRALLNAIESGIKLTIIVPFKSDHILVKDASFPYLKPLLKKGAIVKQYQEGFYHGKIILIDDMCDFGTANFDKRSIFLNNELNCFIENPEFITKIKEEINEDIHRSTTLTYSDVQNRSIFQKGKEAFSLVFSELL